MKNRQLAIIALSLIAAACNSEIAPDAVREIPEDTIEETVPQEAPGYDIQVLADKVPSSKALTAVSGGINFSWNTDEHVYVVNSSGTVASGSLRPETGGSSSTRLSGKISGFSLSEGDEVSLIFPRSEIDYDNQDGTLEGIAASFDYARAGGVRVNSVDGGKVTFADAALAPLQSITNFSFTSGGTPISVVSLTITAKGLVSSESSIGSDAHGLVNVRPDTPSSSLYVALRNDSGAKQTYIFEAHASDGFTYFGTKAAKLDPGMSASTTVEMRKVIKGALNGIFRSAAGKTIVFSQGNLQATLANNNTANGATWKFAPTQYSVVGNSGGNTTLNAYTTVDLFGWSGNSTYPYKYGVNNSTNDSQYRTAKSSSVFQDWGGNVILTADGSSTGPAGTWRTPTYEEWHYLLETRTGDDAGKIGETVNARWAAVTVNGIYGIMLFPAGFIWNEAMGTAPLAINPATDNSTAEIPSSGTYTVEEWHAIEVYGVVFLPAAGNRHALTLNKLNPDQVTFTDGFYWTSTIDESSGYVSARSVHFSAPEGFWSSVNNLTHYGFSVRLVHNNE